MIGEVKLMPHGKFEVFCDPSYYDMWCLRLKGSHDFSETIHFASERDAVHASYIVANWMDS